MDNIVAIIIAAFGSAGLFGFIQFLIKRRDERKYNLGKIIKDLDSIRRDGVRTQLLLLMADYPSNQEEILRLGELYFNQLNGNFYMASLFARWLKDNEIEIPGWFKGK